MSNNTISNPSDPKPSSSEILLTEEQTSAVDSVRKWMDGPQDEFRLGGYAGTGKTTVIKFIQKELDAHSSVHAFTGKACNVLQKKNIHASTLHSLLYYVSKAPGKPVEFIPKDKLEHDPDLIIVDEASMLNHELYTQLKRHKKKLLFVGDPGQLEPVGDNPNLMARCDIVLSKIHRQAEASPIITLANRVRLGKPIVDPARLPHEDLIIQGKSLSKHSMDTYSQIICAKNATRDSLNQKVRANKGLVNKPEPEVGEKLIVLRNNMEYGVFNGLILYVKCIVGTYSNYWLCKCEDEIGQTYQIPIWKLPYTNPLECKKKDLYVPSSVIYTDFGYAITCHKSQGSAWDSVIVVDENMSFAWDMKRWRYTAITRSAKKLLYCI